MKRILKSIFAKVNKMNRFYLVYGGWFVWLIVVDWILFGGTYINYMFFFVGLFFALCGGTYVSKQPNAKEMQSIQRFNELFENVE